MFFMLMGKLFMKVLWSIYMVSFVSVGSSVVSTGVCSSVAATELLYPPLVLFLESTHAPYPFVWTFNIDMN